MVKKLLTSDQKEIDLLARTAWGEARGEGLAGMEKVMHVIMNRVKRGGWWGATVESVVKKPYQFSTWNESDPNFAKMQAVNTSDKQFVAALSSARGIYAGTIEDTTGGATHYHATKINPAWARAGTVTEIYGNHIFYKNIA